MSGTIDRFSNNFDFLRLAGALLVIFFTSFGVAGATMMDPILRLTNGAFTTGSLGISIFFIISGYLITKSWDNRRNIVRFVWARFLRLVPALIGVAIITVFIIGPLTTQSDILDYFTSRATWGYFSIITVFFPAYSLPGVFIHNPVNIVNGALWTLPLESFMYLLVLVLGVVGMIYKKHFTTAIFLAVVGVYLYVNLHTVHTIVPLMSDDLINVLKSIISPIYPVYFLIGSLYYLEREKVRYDIRLVILAFVAWVLTFWNFELFILSSIICIPYVVLGLAFTSIPYLNNVGKKADISYGLYVFHYPVLQTLINFIRLDPLTLFVTSLIITVPLAWLSWHLIESRALGLKDIDFKIFGIRRRSTPRKAGS